MTEPKQPKPELRAGAPIRGLIPQTIEEAARLAEGIYRSGMTPESYAVKARDQNGNEILDAGATTARLLIGILKGMEVGLPPITAISNIVVVNNRPSVWGDAALGLIQNSEPYAGHQEFMEGVEKTDNWTATAIFQRKTPDGENIEIKRTFTWAQAKAAGLTGRNGPWSKYPARMMQMRARAFAMRDGFADVLSGLSIAEEMRDVEVPLIEAPKPEAQADKWTQAALESRVEIPLNFGGEQKEAVPVVTEPQEQPMEARDAFDLPVCETCHGRGIVEDGEGKGPCPDCEAK